MAKPLLSRPSARSSTPAQDDPPKPTATLEIPVPGCFRSDERYFCTKQCPWAKACRKLIAEWLR